MFLCFDFWVDLLTQFSETSLFKLYFLHAENVTEQESGPDLLGPCPAGSLGLSPVPSPFNTPSAMMHIWMSEPAF